MKFIYKTAILFLFIALCSCKSARVSTRAFHGVSVEDFNKLSSDKYTGAKAVVLSETVDVRIQSMTATPWKYFRYNHIPVFNPIGWATTVENKILIASENINGESFSAIEYYYPRSMRGDLMTKCEIWICSLDKNNTIKKRKVNNSEMIRERVNDSISALRLNINENMTGKILLRKYTLISPYYKDTYSESGYARIQPWIFQRDIPLLFGKFEIRLPRMLFDKKTNLKVVKQGDGEMNLESSFVKVTMPYYRITLEQTENGWTSYNRQMNTEYEADKITVSVADVDPRPKNNEQQQPLGIQFVDSSD